MFSPMKQRSIEESGKACIPRTPKHWGYGLACCCGGGAHFQLEVMSPYNSNLRFSTPVRPNHVEPFHFTSGSGHCGAGVSFPSPPALSGRASRALAARQQMAVNPVLPSRIGRPKPCHSEIDPYTSAARIPRAEPTCRRQGRPWSVPLRDSVVRSRSPRVCLSAARPSVRLVRSARAPQHLHLHAAQPFSTCPERR